MRILFTLLFIYFFYSTYLFAQVPDSRLAQIQEAYKSFEYSEVLLLCESALSDTTVIDSSNRIEIFYYQGLAYYALDNMSSAYKSFIQLLNLDVTYAMERATTPPKIFNFFEEIKLEHTKRLIDQQSQIMDIYSEPKSPDSRSIIFSIFLPGTGHLNEGEKTKGWILTTASVITLGSAIYYSIETNDKEKRYLNETNKFEIENAYQKYNQVYKKRNLSLALYAAIWLYTQIDLIYFLPSRQNSFARIRIKPELWNSNTAGISISYKF